MRSFKKALVWKMSMALLAPLAAPAFGAQPATEHSLSRSAAADLLLLEVRLDQHLLSEGITAYQYDGEVFLPLGELARLLTIGIQAEPLARRARGNILDETRPFLLDLAQSAVTVGDMTEQFEPDLAKVEADDIYVASKLITKWLPVNLEVEFASLALRVRPREKLPLQHRLERHARSKQVAPKPGQADQSFPLHDTPYRLLGTPSIDQTLGIDVRDGDGGRKVNGAYTAYLTSDLLGLESSLFVRTSKEDKTPRLGLTVGRHDPDAKLLGPLKARSVLAGVVPVPGVAHIAMTSPIGHGLTVSNRPLAQPTSFDRHTLQGALPPGWEVELYFNDALVGLQQSRGDGRYSFNDLPLMYGPNEFRLVFHGPMGQVRTERQTFFLEHSAVPPGELYYQLTEHRDEQGGARSVAQFDLGVNRHLSATGGITRLPLAGAERRYLNAGLRSFWGSFIVSGDVVRSHAGGSLAEVAVKTRVWGMAASASHARLDRFTSDLYLPGSGAVRWRDKASLTGPIPGKMLRIVQVALEAKRDRLESGADNLEVAGRFSTFQLGTSLTNALRWQSLAGSSSTTGAFNISRRLAGIGLSGQIGYAITPDTSISGAALMADKRFAQGYIFNLGLARSYATRETRYSAGLNKSVGAYGVGLSASYSNRGDVAVGMQLFIGMGREPRENKWLFSAQPQAGNGAASVRVFVDKNQNGAMDAGEEAIKDARFTVNGGIQMARTDEHGIAYLAGLPVKQQVGIAVDAGSLEDPQWGTALKGVRVVPRPGKVIELDYPVILMGEIDGTVYLVEDGVKRGVGDVLVELVDDVGNVIAHTKSASDGYYFLPSVAPGKYQLRVSTEQLQRLTLSSSESRAVHVTPDGSIISGADFSLKRL